MCSLYVNDKDTRTRTRGQVRATSRNSEAVHDARTQDTTIKVTHKSGDPASPSNGRPIDSLPYCTSRPRATEWHQPLWVAAMNKKSIRHGGTQQRRKATRHQGVEEPHMQMPTQLFEKQRATVHTDVKGKHFDLERGTK